MKNGRDDGDHDPKISRIEDERRRRQRGEGARRSAGGGGAKVGAGKPLALGHNLKEWLIGAVIVAMAVGFVASMLAQLVHWAMAK